ncbi:MAG: 3-dehydroquinate synthase family protein [Patescibacteria group bacterium]
MNVLYTVKSIKKELLKIKPSKVVVVVSNNIQNIQSGIVKEVAVLSKAIKVIAVNDGEDLKSWKSIEKLLTKFLKLGLDRKSLIIAIGGGSIGDAVGFASSIYLRGIPYINIPTTLLAQVDSAHGGKTGINFGSYKNQIGTFHESVATVIDPRFIQTLSEEEIVSGLGEIIKAGYLADPSILLSLQKETTATLAQSKKLLTIIRKAIEVKRYCVLKDFKDKGVRQLLNLGHTVSHSIELKYKLSHGRAVIIGMMEEFEMSERAGLSKIGLTSSLKVLLEKLGISNEKKYIPDWNAVMKDKKVSGENLEWPIITEIGKANLVKVSLNNFKDLFKGGKIYN